MGVWLGPRGKPKAKQPPKFTLAIGGTNYSREDFINATDNKIDGVGAYKEAEVTGGIINWELAIFASGTLRFSRIVEKIDLFLCGPGANGGAAYVDESTYRYYGGYGGNGGETKSLTGQNAIPVSPGVDYPLVVGTTGNATTGFGKSAASGGGVSGGIGAYTNNGIQSGGNSTPGTQGAPAFGGTTLYNNGYKYGGGGGGGGSINDIYYTKDASSGGASGGGNGGGGNAAANSGGGGGGGTADRPNWSYNSGGVGGSGIIIIRNHR